MSVCRAIEDHFFLGPKCVHCGAPANPDKIKAGGALPSVGRTVHYYGTLPYDAPAFSSKDTGPYAALVVDVGPGPTTVTLKITDRAGRDHVRANVEYGDPGWVWPPRVG